MLFRNEAKVGLIIFIAIVVLIGVYWFLGGLNLRAKSYPIHAIFSDARKLDKGADVRMAGVKIGVVSDIKLTPTSQAQINMLIWNDNKIPTDSAARITTGGFIGDNYIEVVPGSAKTYLKSGERIRSAQLVQFNQILEDVSGVLKELKQSASNINDILGDKKVVADTKQTIAELKSAAASASDLIASAKGVVTQSSPDIKRAFDHLEVAMANAERVSSDINKLIEQQGAPAVRKILGDTASAVEDLSGAIADARQLISSFRGAASTANEALGKINVVADQANQMMGKLNEASTGIKDLATDQQLMNNLRSTVCNIAATSEQAKQLLTSLNCRFGSLRSGPTPAQKAAIPLYGTSANSLWNTNQGDYRFDANYTFAGKGDSFYRVGLYDVGEHTKLNLQGGMTLNSTNALRYGLYASRLGIGYDLHLGNRLLVMSDLFRPNDPQLEMRGVLDIGNGFGLYGGVLNLLDKDERDVLVGIEYQK